MRRTNHIRSFLTPDELHHHWSVLEDAKKRAAKRAADINNRDREIFVARYETPLWDKPASKLGYQSIPFKLPSGLSNLISELIAITKGKTTKLLLDEEGQPYVNILFDPMAVDDSGIALSLVYSMHCRWDEGFDDRFLVLKSLGLSGII